MTTAVLSGRTLVMLVDIPGPPLGAVPLWGGGDRCIRNRGTEPRACHCHSVTLSGAAGVLGPPVPPCPNQQYPHFSNRLPGTERAHGGPTPGSTHEAQGAPSPTLSSTPLGAGVTPCVDPKVPQGCWENAEPRRAVGGGCDDGRGSVAPVVVNGPWPLSDTLAARSWGESGHQWVSRRPPPCSRGVDRGVQTERGL